MNPFSQLLPGIVPAQGGNAFAGSPVKMADNLDLPSKQLWEDLLSQALQGPRPLGQPGAAIEALSGVGTGFVNSQAPVQQDENPTVVLVPLTVAAPLAEATPLAEAAGVVESDVRASQDPQASQYPQLQMGVFYPFLTPIPFPIIVHNVDTLGMSQASEVPHAPQAPQGSQPSQGLQSVGQGTQPYVTEGITLPLSGTLEGDRFPQPMAALNQGPVASNNTMGLPY